jgi:hypothetical protein
VQEPLVVNLYKYHLRENGAICQLQKFGEHMQSQDDVVFVHDGELAMKHTFVASESVYHADSIFNRTV